MLQYKLARQHTHEERFAGGRSTSSGDARMGYLFRGGICPKTCGIVNYDYYCGFRSFWVFFCGCPFIVLCPIDPVESGDREFPTLT